MIHHHYAAVRLLENVHLCLVVSSLHTAVFRLVLRRWLRGLPVLVHEVSRRAGVYD
jgi:UDP-N-acetylglucosamine:LPS N-acetylglucosamine transferase